MQSTNIYWMPIMYESLLSEIERQQGEKQTDRQTKKKKKQPRSGLPDVYILEERQTWLSSLIIITENNICKTMKGNGN